MVGSEADAQLANLARNNATVWPPLRHCYGAGRLRADPTTYAFIADVDEARASEWRLRQFPPYVFAVPSLHSSRCAVMLWNECIDSNAALPHWFRLNLLHTKAVQARDAAGEIGEVVLVEGAKPVGAEFAATNGIVHHSVAHARQVRYKRLLEHISEAPALWTSDVKQQPQAHANRSSGGESSNSDAWHLPILRHFYLLDWMRTSSVSTFISLDVGTVVYISSAGAWRVLSAARPLIHFASGSAYPPSGTASHSFTAWTNASLTDYVSYVTAHVSIEQPAECGMSGCNGTTVGAVHAYADALHLFWYAMHAHRGTMRSPYNRHDHDWLAQMRSLRSWPTPEKALLYSMKGRMAAQTRKKEACDDSNIACDEHLRWHIPPTSSPFGARFPVWAFWPPQHRVFNLFEPFGSGNVIVDHPAEGLHTRGTIHTGVRGELSGVSSVTHELFEYIMTTHPTRSWYMRSRSKLFTWGSRPGLVHCAPYVSQQRPSKTAALWGWENFAPSTEVHNVSAHADHSRRFFRSWAVAFSTPSARERMLPRFLLVDSMGKEVECASKKGGLELYDVRKE